MISEREGEKNEQPLHGVRARERKHTTHAHIKKNDDFNLVLLLQAFRQEVYFIFVVSSPQCGCCLRFLLFFVDAKMFVDDDDDDVEKNFVVTTAPRFDEICKKEQLL